MRDEAEKKKPVEDADRELSIDNEELNDELMDQPLLMRKWIRLKAQVNRKVRIVQQKLKEVEAKLHLQYAQEGGRVKEIDSKVELNSEVVKLRYELIEAETLAEEYEGIARAFYQRHEALKEICANIRKEVVD